MASTVKTLTAAGNAHTGKSFLRSVTLTPAAAVATCTIDDSTDGSGTDLISLQAAANGSSVVWVAGARDGVWFNTGLRLAAIAGAGAAVVIEYEPAG